MSEDYISKLGAEQKRIFSRMVNGENIFLTGNAGTGKSFLVKAFDQYCKQNDVKILKAAPTGIAACNIQGVTLHRLFKLKTDVKSMLADVRNVPAEVMQILNLASVLLIDEISMVRIDVFDKVMKYIDLINRERKAQKRPDIQIILVGDFYQLAPVIPPLDKKMLDLYYGKNIGNGFAFQSKYWQSLRIQFEKLTEVKRQDGDKAFCTALDQCKEGDTDCLPFFAKNTAAKEQKDAIWVCGKNVTARLRNQERLDKIKKKEYSFPAIYTGIATASDGLCEDSFQCKVGARVIMLVNEPSGDYQNGSMGTIKRISGDEIYVEVERIEIATGKPEKHLVCVERHDFNKYEYREKEIIEELKDERGETIIKKHKELELVTVGSAEQFPMKLGFAITVHKAQGQTYDAMNFKPEIFQDGQLYVALSRCKAADKMFIADPLTPKMVRVSSEVVNYYKNPENYTFFGREKDIISVQTSRDCEGAVKLLNEVFANNKAEILDFLQALSAKKKAEEKEKKEEEKSEVSVAGWNKKGA